MTDARENAGTEELRELRRFVAKRTADIEASVDRLHQRIERRMLFVAVYMTLLAFLVALAVTADDARTFVMFVLIPLFLLALIVYLWQVLLAPHYARERAYRDAMSRVEARQKEGVEDVEGTEGAEDVDAKKPDA